MPWVPSTCGMGNGNRRASQDKQHHTAAKIKELWLKGQYLDCKIFGVEESLTLLWISRTGTGLGNNQGPKLFSHNSPQESCLSSFQLRHLKPA